MKEMESNKKQLLNFIEHESSALSVYWNIEFISRKYGK